MSIADVKYYLIANVKKKIIDMMLLIRSVNKVI